MSFPHGGGGGGLCISLKVLSFISCWYVLPQRIFATAILTFSHSFFLRAAAHFSTRGAHSCLLYVILLMEVKTTGVALSGRQFFVRAVYALRPVSLCARRVDFGLSPFLELHQNIQQRFICSGISTRHYLFDTRCIICGSTRMALMSPASRRRFYVCHHGLYRHDGAPDLTHHFFICHHS